MTFQQLLCKFGIHEKVLLKIYFFRVWGRGFMDYGCRSCSYKQTKNFESGKDLIFNVD